jgi:hypothetical protein
VNLVLEGITWPPCYKYINTDTWSSRLEVGCKAVNLPCKRIIVKSKEVKTRSNLAESSKEGYGSERAVLPMMMTVVVVAAVVVAAAATRSHIYLFLGFRVL